MSAETLSVNPDTAGRQVDPSLAIGEGVDFSGEQLGIAEVARIEHVSSETGPLAVAQELQVVGVKAGNELMPAADAISPAEEDPLGELARRPEESDADYMARLREPAEALEEWKEAHPHIVGADGPIAAPEPETPDANEHSDRTGTESGGPAKETAQESADDTKEEDELVLGLDDEEEEKPIPLFPPEEQPDVNAFGSQTDEDEQMNGRQAVKQPVLGVTEPETPNFVDALPPKARDTWRQLDLAARDTQDGELSERLGAFRQSVMNRGVYDTEQAVQAIKRAEKIGQGEVVSLVSGLEDFLPNGESDEDIFRRVA